MPSSFTPNQGEQESSESHQVETSLREESSENGHTMYSDSSYVDWSSEGEEISESSYVEESSEEESLEESHYVPDAIFGEELERIESVEAGTIVCFEGYVSGYANVRQQGAYEFAVTRLDNNYSVICYFSNLTEYSMSLIGMKVQVIGPKHIYRNMIEVKDPEITVIDGFQTTIYPDYIDWTDQELNPADCIYRYIHVEAEITQISGSRIWFMDIEYYANWMNVGLLEEENRPAVGDVISFNGWLEPYDSTYIFLGDVFAITIVQKGTNESN